ncbi:MAG TPA: 2-hydroxyacyl-CoA dehydratase [Candidatus Baltobacteraceae bacterium]|nr:2-hydroxyacyl-CoA dehydratase [Candidatus Baltobacteraceae bacterium]
MTASVLDESLEELVDRCAQAIEAPGFAEAETWKRQAPGRMLAGCFPVYSPVELLHAAGMLPVGLAGGGNRMEIAHADSRFQSFVCSIIKSTLEQGMTGMLGNFDALVFHSICDPARNLASVYARNFPDQKVEYIHFPQNLGPPEATEYLAREYERIVGSMCQLTGRDVSHDDLRASIEIYNRVRKLIRELYAIRSEAPQRLKTRELYALVRYGHLIPPERHLEILLAARDAIAAREGRPRDRVRAILAGSFCEQPPLDLIAAIEDSGCYVVDDDFVQGRRWFTRDVDAEADDPYYALADAYVNRSVPCAVKHDIRISKSQALVERARANRADAVIVLCAKFCEPALFEYPLYRRALQDAELPHIFLEFEEKMWIFDRIRTEIETFVESLLFS